MVLPVANDVLGVAVTMLGFNRAHTTISQESLRCMHVDNEHYSNMICMHGP